MSARFRNFRFRKRTHTIHTSDSTWLTPSLAALKKDTRMSSTVNTPATRPSPSAEETYANLSLTDGLLEQRLATIIQNQRSNWKCAARLGRVASKVHGQTFCSGLRVRCL